MAVRQVNGLRIGDTAYCDLYEKCKGVRYKVESFHSNRKTLTLVKDELHQPDAYKKITTSIKNIESEFFTK